MAGTVTKEEIVIFHVKKLTFDWTSGTSGDEGKADSTSIEYYTGMIERVVFEYGDATADYDVTVKDDDGLDVLIGNGADVPAADTQIDNVSDGLGAVVATQLTLAVTNAGDTKTGKVHIYIR